MNAHTILTVLLAVVFATLGMAKLLAVPPMQQRAAHVGFGVPAYRRIGTLEVAGATGLALGPVSALIPAAAALGLLCLLIGAIAAHIHAGDGLKGATPALALALVVVIDLALDVVNL